MTAMWISFTLACIAGLVTEAIAGYALPWLPYAMMLIVFGITYPLLKGKRALP
jgi:hypothetical protein